MVEETKKKDAKLRAVVRKAILLLDKEYGVPSPKPYKDPLEELVFTILSQNTNDQNRDRAFAALRSRFPTWEDVMRAPGPEIARAIKVGGLANQKGERIKRMLTLIHETYGKLELDFLKELPIEEAKKLLGSFNGVGPKTVACVLLFACAKPVFPVDTHIFRVASRLGLLPEKCSDVRAHEIMNCLVPPGKVYSFHINLIKHGRQVCKPARPKCVGCALRQICPSRDKFK